MEDCIRDSRDCLKRLQSHLSKLEHTVEGLQQENARLYGDKMLTKSASVPIMRHLSLRVASSDKDSKDILSTSPGGSVKFSKRHSRRMSTSGLGTLHEIHERVGTVRTVREKLCDLQEGKLSKPVLEQLFGHGDYVSEVVVNEKPKRGIGLVTLRENRRTIRFVAIALEEDWYQVKIWAGLNQIPISQVNQ